MGRFPRDLSALRSVHILGISGTLMGAFAVALAKKKIRVTGSDQNCYPPMSDVLRAAGIQVFEGYHSDTLSKLSPKPDLIVIGNVIRKDNPEAVAVMRGDVPYCSLPEFMEEILLDQTQNYVVAGTHGKTTSSSMLAFVFRELGLKPGYFVGGVSEDLPESFSAEGLIKGTPFVLEGDEYDTVFWDKVPKFFHYKPDHVILTSMEFDHADIYADMEAVRKAFRGLAARVRKNGTFIVCQDFLENEKLVQEKILPTGTRVITYGAGEESRAEYRAVGFRDHRDHQIFRIEGPSGYVQEDVRLRLAGRHNVANALGVFLAATEVAALKPAPVIDALARFRGVRRRQEIKGEFKGVLVIDDFAHHPTAVRATIQALKRRFPERRMVVAFEPRSATSRRKIFQQAYVQSFLEADATWIAEPYDQSRIGEGDRFSSDELVSELKAKGRFASVFTVGDDGFQAIARSLKTGDVFVVLSNGGFGGLATKIGPLLR